jgi:hypothetical protein
VRGWHYLNWHLQGPSLEEGPRPVESRIGTYNSLGMFVTGQTHQYVQYLAQSPRVAHAMTCIR